ncbi:MAG TPA: 2-oxo acid dehydrogenase subunit E2 [Ktedonobacterales bacterium]|nr:2-oxo acid dehydrogenase subunit E2 [Ktedonobacterales bacterium]
MATKVFMPALGMAQETGTLVRWLKAEGDEVREGDVLAEIQTDKATEELEARASGTLATITAREGEDVPVGQVIAMILAPGEQPAPAASSTPAPAPVAVPASNGATNGMASNGANGVSPLARRIAAERGIDPQSIPASGRRVQKADVIAYLDQRPEPAPTAQAATTATAPRTADGRVARLLPASPKARRLARERGVDLAQAPGSGPGAAVITRDVLAFAPRATATAVAAEPAQATSALHPVWRIMAERTTQSWQQIPHFFLLREINASRMIAWREQARRQRAVNITYTDLLVMAVAHTLRAHPRVNASWVNGGIVQHPDVNVALAVAADYGLVTPVIHRADTLDLGAIAARRTELVQRAQSGKQRSDDLANGTFTISNLGMYGVDAFNAIVPGPQAAILAVGRIVERVVPLHGVPAVQPMMALSLSCDHRVIDGARGAEFLGALADLLEEPLALLS